MTPKREKPVLGAVTPGRAGKWGETLNGFGGGHAAGFARPNDIIRQNDGDIQPANKVIGINQVYHAADFAAGRRAAGRHQTTGQRQMFGIHSQVLQSVVYLLSIGVSVLPLPYASKTPARESVEGARDGKGWKDTTRHRLPHSLNKYARDDDKDPLPYLADLFTPVQGLPANLAAVCGAISGNLFVLDYDGRAAYERAIATLQRLNVPVFASISGSGNGGHIWLRCSSGELANGKIKLDGQHIGDIKANRAYVVVPPSRHPSGGFYAWDARKSMYTPPTYTLDELNDIARELPGQPVLKLNKRGGGGGAERRKQRSNDDGLHRDTLDYLQRGVPENTRNNRLYDAARDYAYNGRTLDDAHRDLGARARFDGLEDAEIQRTIESGYKSRAASNGKRATSAAPQGAGQRATMPDDLTATIYNRARAWLDAQQFTGRAGLVDRAVFAAMLERYRLDTFAGTVTGNNPFRASRRELAEIAMPRAATKKQRPAQKVAKSKRFYVDRSIDRLIERGAIVRADRAEQRNEHGATLWRFGAAIIGILKNCCTDSCNKTACAATCVAIATNAATISPSEDRNDNNGTEKEKIVTTACNHGNNDDGDGQRVPHREMLLLWSAVCDATDKRIYDALTQQTTSTTAADIARAAGLNRSTVTRHLSDDAPLRVQGLVKAVAVGKRQQYVVVGTLDGQRVASILAACDVDQQRAEIQAVYAAEREERAVMGAWKMLNAYVQHRLKHPALWAVGQLDVIEPPTTPGMVWPIEREALAIAVDVLHQRDGHGQQIIAPQIVMQGSTSTMPQDAGQRVQDAPQYDAMPDDPFGVSLFDDMPLFDDDQRDGVPQDDVFGPPPFDDSNPFGDAIPDDAALIAFRHAMARECVAVQS